MSERCDYQREDGYCYWRDNVCMALTDALDKADTRNAQLTALVKSVQTEAADIYKRESERHAATAVKLVEELAEAQAQMGTLLGQLNKYGDHRHGCAITKYIRDSELPPFTSPKCNCGWLDTMTEEDPRIS